MRDLILAIVHHLGMFALFGALAVELVTVKPGMTHAAAASVVKVDRLYGAMSGLMLAAGFARAVFAAKGWEYYAHNGFFWAKIGVFALVGALSVLPSLKFIAWGRAGIDPHASEVARVRLFLLAQVGLFALIPVFAAAMARGHGAFQ